LHPVRVRSIEADGSLHVQALEAIDGMPVIDIKPALTPVTAYRFKYAAMVSTLHGSAASTAKK
jgi:tRNA (Thr-GGU) A37 N-methylase